MTIAENGSLELQIRGPLKESFKSALLPPRKELLLLLFALQFQNFLDRKTSLFLCNTSVALSSKLLLLEALMDKLLPEYWGYARREYAFAQKHGVEFDTVFDLSYPKQLLQIPDPPVLLYRRGRLFNAFGVALVGSRACSAYGKRTAFSLGRQIASSGVAVVSGLALGIDSAAHRGALESAKLEGAYPGVAVLGSGLLSIYPANNKGLAGELLEYGGAVISEYPLFAPARAFHFPKRNRIISGLSAAVVVVEAARRSGALITANLAAEQGREVFAVPGPVDQSSSQGTNQLISSGAAVMRDFLDLRTELPYLVGGKAKRQAVGINKDRKGE